MENPTGLAAVHPEQPWKQKVCIVRQSYTMSVVVYNKRLNHASNPPLSTYPVYALSSGSNCPTFPRFTHVGQYVSTASLPASHKWSREHNKIRLTAAVIFVISQYGHTVTRRRSTLCCVYAGSLVALNICRSTLWVSTTTIQRGQCSSPFYLWMNALFWRC